MVNDLMDYVSVMQSQQILWRLKPSGASWLVNTLISCLCYTERDLPSTGSFLRWLQRPGLGQAKAKSQELLPSLPHGCRCPMTWIIFFCFSQAISRELGWKRSSQDTNQCPNGIWQLYPLCHSTSPDLCPLK